MIFISSLAVVVLIIFFCNISSQDLQYGCITCQDKFDKCEIDCALNYQVQGVSSITGCQAQCTASKSECVDTATAVACQECSLKCAISYDSSLRKCLVKVPREFNQDTIYSACESDASSTMDSCMDICRETYALKL